LEKRGKGRFSEEYVFSIMDSLVNVPSYRFRALFKVLNDKLNPKPGT
jgi:hypothetical protein